MAAKTSPIVKSLDLRTRAQLIRGVDLAQALGVGGHSVSQWRNGQRSPHFPSVVAWAAHLGTQIVAVDAHGRVLAVGDDIPAGFATWREAAGLTQKAVADLRCTAKAAIAQLEACARRPYLATVEDHLAALNIRLAVVDAADSRGVAA
ncbi:hypothetical protein N5079_19615 [Planotetraspora sp. A-T 1434]|uniref:helix-turn-helix domain-containing protein n=1 Tax=Planotetraspora sp. A-T 1434 TaxID=2979219 RepID=UPI0021C1BFF6|nr:hypothetical protein [Planotetraspora sp. A-T 1434]MCT9932412.1 hypothetical protein [Planotetraspora sp. A-T 1434]